MQLIGPTRLSGDMSSFTKGEDGLYRVPIVALGERLRDNFGLTIREHSHFDPVDPVHSPNSYHYYDEAIDVQDWRADDINGVDWRTRTGNLETLLRGSGAEVIGPNSGIGGHDSHLHLAAKDGIFTLNDHQYQTLFGGNAGGKLATFQESVAVLNPATIPPPILAHHHHHLNLETLLLVGLVLKSGQKTIARCQPLISMRNMIVSAQMILTRLLRKG